MNEIKREEKGAKRGTHTHTHTHREKERERERERTGETQREEEIVRWGRKEEKQRY